MAAGILEDILKSNLTADDVIEWLSNEKHVNEDNSVFRQYDCSQVQFVSFFLTFLREESSRNFQVYDAETPRKNTSSKIKIKSTQQVLEKSVLHLKSDENALMHGHSVNCIDLESLQSFPSLSSGSSNKMDSTEQGQTHQGHKTVAGMNGKAEKKPSRVKLFSETVDECSKGSQYDRKDLNFFDGNEAGRNRNRFAVSTPKVSCKTGPPHGSEYFQGMDAVRETPKIQSKFADPNHCQYEFSSSEISELSISKTKSFSGMNHSSYKNKESSSTSKMNCRMSLGDFILSEKSLNISSENKRERKGRTKRRLNLTKVSGPGGETPKGTMPDEAGWQFDGDKDILQEAVETSCRGTPSSKPQVYSGGPGSLDSADPSAVAGFPARETELKILTKIYSFLISDNYCQNIMIELCFIASLLVVRDSDKKTTESTAESDKLFGSTDSCVYFAVEMLWLQRGCLLHLNLSALKLLSENKRIERFNGELKEFLVTAYLQSQRAEDARRHRGLVKSTMQENVSFQYETDNRENFTSDISFHSFKKQRDLFYNILAIWEANHLVSGWIFSVGLASKIRTLLAISTDPINLLHLARLFRNQLITSCCGESQLEVIMSMTVFLPRQEDQSEKILQLLPSADPTKLLRLRARLTSSPKRQGPCPLPDFTGHQEFYKDFILYASNGVFREHLKNSLCDEILRLNDADLTGDVEDEDSSLDEQAEERFRHCVNVLRLLGKFLGFLEFMPYRGEKSFSERISNIHCSVRNNILPLFDVDACLLRAISNSRLILTVPWVVSYLSMIDPYSALLKTYLNVWRTLIIVYRHLKTIGNARNRFYLRLTLGWLFQLPSFPPEHFYKVLDVQGGRTGPEAFELPDVGDRSRGLDSYDVMDDSVLYAVCPYLNEINVILSEDSGCNVRHIRPVTTQENDSMKSQASKQLQLRLESNFLHNQTSSTRKTVDFVTERVASITMKHLAHRTIPNVKKTFLRELDGLLANDPKNAEDVAESLSKACHDELLSACQKENVDIVFKRSEAALKALLSGDLQPSIADTCVKIVVRQAIEKVERWIQSHVTLAMVKKEFLAAICKKSMKRGTDVGAGDHRDPRDPYHLPVRSPERQHQDSAWPASKTIKAIRDFICGWGEEEGVSALRVLGLVEEAVRTVRGRNDLIPAAEKALTSLALDLVIIFCVRSGEVDAKSVIEKLVALLEEVGPDSHACLDRIICPRNVAIISREADARARAWRNIADLLFVLLEEGFLVNNKLETQFLSLFRLAHEKDEGDDFASFISHFIDRYKKIYDCDKFSLLLEYMLDTLNEEEPRLDDSS